MLCGLATFTEDEMCAVATRGIEGKTQLLAAPNLSFPVLAN
jgi:hypothetical protein